MNRPIITEVLPDIEERYMDLTPNDVCFCFSRIEDGYGYDAEDAACQVCVVRHRCEKRTLEKIQALVVSRESGAKESKYVDIRNIQNSPRKNKDESGLLTIPEPFKVFDNSIQELKHVYKVPKKTCINYYYKNRKQIISITKPLNTKLMLMVFFRCNLSHFKDPKQRLWLDDKSRVCIYVKPRQLRYAFYLVKQLHKYIDSKYLIFKDKNAKRDLDS